MRSARRQHRASPLRPRPAATRGIRMALAALYSVDPVTPEQAAAIQQQLEAAPYRKPQGELTLAFREPVA